MSPSEYSPTPYRTPGVYDIEEVQKYVVGGYHPVNIGDWLSAGDRRYRVIHKLGSGGFSTVWWVQSSVDQRYYALKVMCADSGDDQELETMHKLSDRRVKHPNVNFLLDFFPVRGPNGTHLCLVFPLLGPSLKRMWKRLSKSSRHRVCRQIASGLTFLHEQGICHGDLTPSNILFELRDIQTWSEAQIYDTFGDIRTEELRLHNGSYSEHAPKEVVRAVEFTNLEDHLLDNIRIIDFGQSYNANEPPTGLGTPLFYFPPELCFGYPPSKKSDVWALACIIFEVQTWRPLVPMVFQNFEILVGTLRFTLGTLPLEWRTKYSDDYASNDLHGQGAPDIWFDEKFPLEWPLPSLIDEKASHLSPDEKEELLHLLRAMLAFEPSQRISAKEVLDHPWIRKTPSGDDLKVIEQA
ncbi:kinase-like protein [Hypoxylon sp. FL0890]|nr:kinase-like protein [Hypoxylon sp. FL0890]